ncbi:MAG: hypothetical protein EYC67_07575 [Betaproteobacteria bacterium]|nr:MAG: hypothetical protein EYC67_07575 [Betaproteobacteria bacterium]
MNVAESPAATNPYDRTFARLCEDGNSYEDAVLRVTEDYLDGKPRLNGKRKITKAERDLAFWLSDVVQSIPAEHWRMATLALALSHYFAQERVANPALLADLSRGASDVICHAVRRSGLVLQQHSPRRTELDLLAATSNEIAELCRVLDIFDLAHRERRSSLEIGKAMLANLSPFELLVYASLYAFEHLVPHRFGVISAQKAEGTPTEQEAWEAINDLLHWKLETVPEAALRLSETEIGASLAEHLSPFLFPSPMGRSPRHDLRSAFEQLLLSQVELNSFISRSADAFSYDDGIRFERRGRQLEIEEADPAARCDWNRDGHKLNRLHGYWFFRGLEEFVALGLADKPMGRPENQEANRLAYIQALRTQLRLMEVYGVDSPVTAESGAKVALFPALLSLELMSAHFQRDFLMAYAGHLADSGHCIAALNRLAMEGLADGLQNRLPLTWSDRETKIANIVGWTVSAEFPQGNPRAAAAILDFWTTDLHAMGKRLRDRTAGLQPEFCERPILKQGQTLIQLPWVVGLQNNSTAAINNLRRLGARRGETGVETRRIEERVGLLFEQRGFRVALNWHPRDEDAMNAGEIDLICARDDIVIVMEVKSTYLRRSQRDAWLHATTTLRKAGQQLRKKVAAVRAALVQPSELGALLGIDAASSEPAIHGLIVDTSIECDHQQFGGYLKVSVEEVLIALRDERHLLRDLPDGLAGDDSGPNTARPAEQASTTSSLYPEGFDAAGFLSVIRRGAVWDDVPD